MEKTGSVAELGAPALHQPPNASLFGFMSWTFIEISSEARSSF